jgi:hypothetical protein
VIGDIITARSVAFQKQPDNANAKAGGTLPGCLTAAKLTSFSGSFNDGMLNQRRDYRTAKLSVFDQLKVSRKLLPVLAGMVSDSGAFALAEAKSTP